MPDYFLLKDYYTTDSSIDSYDLESDETQDWGEEGEEDDVADELEVDQDPGVQDEEERSLPERSWKRCREEDEEEEEKRSTKGLRHDLEYSCVTLRTHLQFVLRLWWTMKSSKNNRKRLDMRSSGRDPLGIL